MSHRLAFVLLATSLMSGCGVGTSDHRAWTTRDSWYREVPPTLPPSWDERQWQKLSQSQWVNVRVDQHARSEQMLSQESHRELTPAEVVELTGEAVTLGAERAILVRGVMLRENGGGFTIREHDHYLHIHHGTLGGAPLPMKRTALVVFLPYVPKDGFATCSMAQ